MTGQDLPFIRIEGVSKSFGTFQAVKDVNLTIRKGEIFALLGGSGCGKTTLLRMLAGFEDPTAGTIFIDGQDMTGVPPWERPVHMMFQSYALFPHLSVWDNITFGLQLQKLPQAEMEKRARMAMEILHLEGYENKKTYELSGGQKQRVALCRALVKQSPYFLLDEPLSNLDAKLRQKARTELVKIHEMFKPTMVYVTHDQIEAMTVAHRIAVMNQGRIQQIDTPANIYHHPANTFVATFIGSPAMNILQAEILDGKIIVGDCALKLPHERLQELGGRSKVLFGLRPEACTPSFESAMINGKADFVENTGNLKTATLKLATCESFYLQDSDQGLQMEDISGFNFDWQNVCLFDAESGENLAKVR